MTQKKIKVMHILLSLEFGGAEKVVVNLVNKLYDERFDFSICVMDRIGALRDELNSNMKVICMERKGGGVDFALPARLAKVMREVTPDIIHMHNPTALLYGTISGKMAGARGMIVTQHGSVSVENPRMRFVTTQLSKIIDKNIPVSAEIEEYLKSRCKVRNDKLETIINGIDDSIYRPNTAERIDGKKRLDLKDNIVIGHIARFSAEKDQRNLLKAFSVVVKKIDNSRLIMVGDGPMRSDLELFAKELNIADKVLFTGFRRDIPALLNMFDIFVLSSLREGTSLTLIEAMATELPIVATNVGGNPNVIVDKITGLLVPPSNPGRLADALIHLCRDRHLREEMGKAGRRVMEEKFSLTMMAEKYAKLYQELARSSD